MKERYLILKNLYPNYLIFFIAKEKIKCIGETKDILDIFLLKNIKNVNKIIVSNLEIIEKEEFKDNKYDLYLAKTKLIKLVISLKEIGWSV